jgi:hypothetical protein
LINLEENGRSRFEVDWLFFAQGGDYVTDSTSSHDYCCATDTYHQHPILFAEHLVVDIHTLTVSFDIRRGCDEHGW